jgi:hypothetical protein
MEERKERLPLPEIESQRLEHPAKHRSRYTDRAIVVPTRDEITKVVFVFCIILFFYQYIHGY